MTTLVTRPEIDWMFGRVQAALGATRDEILNSNIREKHVVAAREACALWLRQRGLSYGQIGRVLVKDHSTIHAAVKRAKARRLPTDAR